MSGLSHNVLEKADACAIRIKEESITYGELFQKSKKLAGWLCQHSMTGQRIGIKLENGIAFFACFYGIVLAGSIAVPLPADLPKEQLQEWCEHLKIARVLAGVPFTEESLALPVLGPDALFYMAVSSGSTGKPKGILRSHRSWVESFQRMKEAFGTGKQDRLLLPGPLHYSASLIAALQVLHEGGEVRLLPRYRSADVRAELLQGDVTACFMVPALYTKLLADKELACEVNLTFISAGDKLSAATSTQWLQAFPNSRLYEYYGAAEISFVSYLRHDRDRSFLDSVGQPFPGVELIIRNEQGQQVQTGTIGKVYVSSSMVAQKYGHLSAPPFLKPTAGGYTVGDLGYLDEAGFLYLVGRKQEVIVRGGVNLYPAEIERSLLADPLIGEAAVFGVPDEMLGERIIAAVSLVGQDERLAQGLAEKLQNRFARTRRPDDYWVLPQLPRNAAGKMDKKRLKEMFFTQKEGLDK